MGIQYTPPQNDSLVIAAIRQRSLLREQLAKIPPKPRHVPIGNLRVVTNHNRPQYYIVNSSDAPNGTYLPRKEIRKAQAIAQRDYNRNAADALKKQISTIDRFLADYRPGALDATYTELHPGRRVLVAPVHEPDEDFIAAWLHHPYTGKPFEINAPEFYTGTGVRVRSKSEVIIADALSRAGVPFRYEYPTSVKGWGTLYPDFTCLDKRSREEIIWEHFGLMSDPDYAEKTVQKIAHYAASGYILGKNFIATFETAAKALSVKQVEHYIRALLI
jgi:hypothetical protein